MDLPSLVAVLVAAFLGAAVQTVLGFGGAFTTVPLLAVVAPELLPVTSIVAFLPLTAIMAWRERAQADLVDARRIILARLPGILVGTWIVATLNARGIAILVAVVLLIAVLAITRGWEVAITPASLRAAGFVSGVSGAAAGLGGPPLGLLYRRHAGPRMRATLAMAFAAGISMSLASLSLAGQVTAVQVTYGLILTAATVSGTFVAKPIADRLSVVHLRTGVLTWAGLGSVVALGRALA